MSRIADRNAFNLILAYLFNLKKLENSNKNAGANDNVLLFTVDGKEYKSHDQYLTGAQIRKIVSAPDESLECLLFLSVPHPWIDELIQNEKPVDLAREEIEHFYFKNVLLLIINGKQYTWEKEYITGAEIKKLGGIAEKDELFLAIKKPWPDEPVPDDKEINLARPGIENFYSKEPKMYTFYIDKKPYTTFNQFLSVKQILVDFAKVDPATNTLAEKIPGGFHEFKDQEEQIDLCNIRYFTLFNNTPTTVS